MLKKKYDLRRNLLIGSTEEEAVEMAARDWIAIGEEAIAKRGRFAVALSGGSTPKKIYQALCRFSLDWSKVFLFWSDERSVFPDHADSNYRMAMNAAFSFLPIPPFQIFRMKAEESIAKHAFEYEEILGEKTGGILDLVMLGVGEDGHIASLFPATSALKATGLVAPNFVPSLNTWRMTLTLRAISQSRSIALYALGANKAGIVHAFLSTPDYPASLVGSEKNPLNLYLDSASLSLH